MFITFITLRSKDRRIGPVIKKTRLVKTTKLKVLFESDVNLSCPTRSPPRALPVPVGGARWHWQGPAPADACQACPAAPAPPCRGADAPPDADSDAGPRRGPGAATARAA